MNVLGRLSLPDLQALVGEARLEQIAEILSIVSDEDHAPSTVYQRRFLTNYILSNLSVRSLFEGPNFKELLNSLSPQEFKLVCDGLGIESRNRERVEGAILKGVTSKEFRLRLLPLLGLERLLPTDIDPITSPALQYFDAAQSPYKPLKDYQFKVFFDCIKELSPLASRFIMQMPTGSGKTRTAIEIACDYLNRHPGASVIWIAHSTELCDQACQCFCDVWPHLAKSSLRLQRWYGKYKTSQPKELMSGFICATFQSLRNQLSGDPDNFCSDLHDERLIIVDEAHKAVATTYKEVIKALITSSTRVMGLTATPGRSFNDDDANLELSDFFFNKIISFDPEGMNAIEYLRERKILSKAIFEPLIVSCGELTLTSKELDSVKRFFELPPSVLTKLGASAIRNAEILVRIKRLVISEGYKSVLYFGTSLEQSRLIDSLLKLFGISSAHVDGGSPSVFRNKVINDFRSQDINVLCNYEVLSTGFDAPLVDCVFIARPTSSVVLYSQMIGRGLRGPEIGGGARCLVVNVKDNITNLPGVDEMFTVFSDYWSIS